MMNDEDMEVELIFIQTPQIESALRKMGIENDGKPARMKVDNIVKWFKEYKINNIEINIEGVIDDKERGVIQDKERGTTKLFVSSEGKGGCRVTISPG